MTTLPFLISVTLATGALTPPAADSAAAPTATHTAAPGSSTTRVVGPDAAYRTVTAALAASAAHDTVRVRPGVYREPTLVVEHPLVLLADPGVVLDGDGVRGLIEVRADSVTVRGFVLRNTGLSFTDDRAAILVDRARFCSIEANRLQDTFFGIYLANAGDCTVSDNVLRASGERETRSGNGIHLWYSARITVEGNRVEGHRDGIYFEFVEDSRVAGNVSRANLRYGLHFMFSDGCAYERNVFRQNGAGVAVMYTRDVLMTANDFDDNRGSAAFGLLLKDITDSRVAGNRFRRNSVALRGEGLNKVEVTGNDFVANGWAVQVLANSERTVFMGNNFVANSFDVSTNSRKTSSTFEGNYWDRYRGWDRDRDGYGDIDFRPVRLFSLVVERNEPTVVLQRSLLVAALDLAESVLPVLTPSNLVDRRPALRPLPSPWRDR